MTDRRRVVITGLGAITPSGLDVPSMWDAVVHGRSAITTLDDSEFAGLAVRIGGQVRGFEVSTVLAPSLARRLRRSQHWAVAAADQALAQAGWTPGATDMPWDPNRFSVIAATGSGPVDAMQEATRALDQRGPRAVPLTLAIYGAPDAAAAVLSQRYQSFGPAQGVSATCASGAIALGEAMRRIRHGYADAVLVVGVEDCLNPVNLASNANMRALASGYEHDPAAASRPFDRARSGFVMSAGAAAILL
ncbi:MAG: beta-ketoacyl synthase N-terminal-like domain-containing protein, partial [Microbacteriaceae bacterium]